MRHGKQMSYGILIADDSENDRLLLRSALRAVPELQVLAEVGDGEKVRHYLEGAAPFSDRSKYPLPHLLLLDLKMPRMDGFAVLAWLKTRALGSLRVVVLTDSIQPEHLKQALDLGADLFQLKARTQLERNKFAYALKTYLEGAPLPV